MFQPVLSVFALISAIVASVLLSACSGGMFGDDKKFTTGIPKKSEAAYYADAQNDIVKKRYDLAEKTLDDLRTFYPVGVHAQDAALELIYVKYMQSEYPETVIAADRFVRLYPNHKHADYALYVKGIANMNSGFGGLMKYTNLKQAHRDTAFLRVAFANFETLVNNYPNSPYASDAAARMYYIYNQLAESEMNTARWYIKRKAYVGALERARWVFQYYPQSIQTPEAIATLAYTHEKLGNAELAGKYKNLLRLNYPSLISGDRVNLSAARTDASWFNKVTLGVLGRAGASVKFEPVQSEGTRIQTITRRSGLSLPKETLGASDMKTAPRTQTYAAAPSLTFGLGLPENSPTASTSDTTTNRDAAMNTPQGRSQNTAVIDNRGVSVGEASTGETSADTDSQADGADRVEPKP